MTHTPAEWTLEWVGFEAAPAIIARRADGSPITICVLGTGHATDIEANARLIAAAPDMLAALKMVLDFHLAQPKVAEGSQSSVVDAVRAVIAKAES